MEQVQRISEWPIMGKVSTHGEGFGGFFGYNSQWSDVVVGLELNYTHGKFGGYADRHDVAVLHASFGVHRRRDL